MKIVITKKGLDLIADADKQGGIYPNPVYFLAAIKDGKAYDTDDLEKDLRLSDFAECYIRLMKHGFFIQL